MQLKDYQTDTLNALGDFLQQARIDGARTAYEAQIAEPARAKLLGRWANGYRALSALPDVPCVCLRVPTGGGKTLLAAHSIAIARDNWIERERPFVLWLTPSDMIRRQTLDALKNPRHFYRQAINEKFGGQVRVFDIADFDLIRPHDLQSSVCIVVGTIQTLRVTSTDGRKVYSHNEALEPHFAGLALEKYDLEKTPDGKKVKLPFANLMHIHRPLMIVDEAHNAVTSLSQTMQARVNPCAIIEFTATPRFNSNILYSVSAWTLKDAEMIKLPIRLQEHPKGWEDAVSASLATHAILSAKAAQDRSDYIRPIVLFQAQPKDEEVTVAALKAHLIEVENVAPEKIAIATGDQRELEGVNLFDRACPVEFVITVEALREGWDCSFAYVLTSVPSIRSETSVEQLLGRVLRMPYARKRMAAELNWAYAHVSEKSFAAAANALKDCLTRMGFEEQEAISCIAEEQLELGADGEFTPRQTQPPLALIFNAPAASAIALRKIDSDKITLETGTDGGIVLRVEKDLSPELEAEIAAALPEQARPGFCEQAASYRAEMELRLTPAQKGATFVAPALMAVVQGELRLADWEEFWGAFDWSLRNCAAVLAPADFSPGETSVSFEIDLNARSVSVSALGEEDRLVLDPQVPGWDKINLAQWLDRRLYDSSTTQEDLQDFILRALDHLTIQRGLSVAVIWRSRFRLVQALKNLMEREREKARTQAHQLFLFAPEARPQVSVEAGFVFSDKTFTDERFQPGGGRFAYKKHFLGPDRIPAFDGKPDGEEAQCAFALESFPQVDYWLRNTPRPPHAFRLPLAKGWFYPDFIAKLKDGRIFVVEYKGEPYVTNDDSRIKNAIGQLWERSGGGLFLMVEKMKHGLDMRAQLKAKLEG